MPRNDGRRLRLNALVAAGNVGGDGERNAVTAYVDDPDDDARASSPPGRWSGWRSGMLSRPGRWLVLLRAALVVVGAIAVALTDFPPSYEPWAWAVVGFFAAVTVVSACSRGSSSTAGPRARAVLLLALDGVVAIGFIAVFSFQAGEPYRALY